MSRKQLKAKYANSLLGFSWAFVNPLLLTAGIAFVFNGIFKIDIPDFPFFALAGILPWAFFSAILSESAQAILGQRNILHQFHLPREIIPLSCILSNFLNFCIGLAVIYPLFLFLNPKVFSLFPLLALCVFLNLLFVAGAGMAVSVLNVFFRDLAQLLNIALMFGFWVTPVFYSPEMIPLRLRWVVDLNPMTPFVVFFRDVVFFGKVPGLPVFAAAFFWASASLALGWVVFRKTEGKILKWL